MKKLTIPTALPSKMVGIKESDLNKLGFTFKGVFNTFYSKWELPVGWKVVKADFIPTSKNGEFITEFLVDDKNSVRARVLNNRSTNVKIWLAWRS